MSEPKAKILLAEDDTNLGHLLVKFLKKEGYYVELFSDGEAALEAFTIHAYDICLLDVMMPTMDGYTLLKKIRTRDKKTPIILITAKSLKKHKQNGYELGADDYLTKPFDEEELLWKIKVFVRRVPNKNAKDIPIVSVGKYQFDFKNQSLKIGEETKRITGKESDILKYLYEHRNNVIKREDMLNDLWGENDYFLGRSLDVFITKIRKLLKQDSDLRIENIFNVGFIFHVS